MKTTLRAFLLAGGLALNVALLEGLTLPFVAVFVLDLALLIDLAVFLFRRDRDMLQPLALIVVVYALRLGLPACLLLAGGRPESIVPPGWTQPRYWQPGFYLAAVGCFALGLAFLITPSAWTRSRRFAAELRPTSSAVLHTAQLVTLVGSVLWLVYMASNFGGLSGILAALSGGLARGTRFHVEGTSRYAFIARQFMLWGTVVWGISRHESAHRIRASIFPALAACVLMLSNGGRVVAVTAPVLVLMVIWYRTRRNFGVQRVNLRRLARWTVGAAAALALFIAGGLLVKGYRGGGGFQNAARLARFDALVTEFKFSAWYETGLLHPFAFAIREGGGNYHPPLGRYLFSGYTAYFAGVREVTKPGQFIIQRDLGVSGWGIHTGAFVDLYMGFGVLGTVLGGALLGAALKLVYERYAQRARSSLELVIYAYTFWHIFWVLFESVVGVFSGWFENAIALFLLLGIAAVLRKPGRRLPRRVPARAPLAPVPTPAP